MKHSHKKGNKFLPFLKFDYSVWRVLYPYGIYMYKLSMDFSTHTKTLQISVASICECWGQRCTWYHPPSREYQKASGLKSFNILLGHLKAHALVQKGCKMTDDTIQLQPIHLRSRWGQLDRFKNNFYSFRPITRLSKLCYRCPITQKARLIELFKYS